MAQHSKKVTPIAEEEIPFGDSEVVRFPITYEVVVDEIELSPYGGFNPVESALLVVANQHSKLAEEANGTYRFAIPDRGKFAVTLDFTPDPDRVRS